MKRNMTICFVVDLPAQRLGGAEVQSELIGKGLLNKGWQVSFLTSDDLSRPPTMFRVFTEHGMMRWLAEGLHAASLIRLLIRINPRIVVVAYADPRSEVATLYAFLYRRKLVFRAGHIFDADLTFSNGTGWNDFSSVAKFLHSLTVRRADVIVTNALYVANAFKRLLPEKGVLTIRNGQKIRERSTRNREPSHVLWIATMNEIKNPMLFVRLAKALPAIRFVMCGEGPLYVRVQKHARGVRNLRLVGKVLGQTKAMLLDTSYVIVNTSSAEGFPNTLIEAGIHMVPYISFVDPDEVICRYDLGFHVNSFSELVRRTAQLAGRNELRRKTGASIRSYVEREHDIYRTVSEYDTLLQSLL